MVVLSAQKLCPKLNVITCSFMHRIESGSLLIISDLFVVDCQKTKSDGNIE